MARYNVFKMVKGKWARTHANVSARASRTIARKNRGRGVRTLILRRKVYPWVTGDIKGLDPDLLAALNAIGKELGKKVDVLSGFRTYAEQKALYQAYKNGTGNLAAVPGTSRHETGRAADAYVDGKPLGSTPVGRTAAKRHGVIFPVSGEDWHSELAA